MTAAQKSLALKLAVDALRRIADVNPDTLSDHPEHSARMAVALGTAKGIAQGTLDIVERHLPKGASRG